jgi:Asp-tRNA(Asn)/Glu-tRNA(Gln) amidotransferase A subunit family amidase
MKPSACHCRAMLGLLVSGLLLLSAACPAQETALQDSLTATAVEQAATLLGLEFTPVEIDSLLPDLAEQLDSYHELRSQHLDNAVPPALYFRALPPGRTADIPARPPSWSDLGAVTRPLDPADLAFMSVAELGALLRSGQVTSVELTRLYLERLERFGPQLECVVNLLPEHALAAAAQADVELAAGRDRGPLHGIPCGVKDLFAVAGAPTTWGAMPYKDQVIDDTATVVEKLEAAGAVLVAKLTLGALAWGDVWFGGKTRNPWNPEQGSSGSSAGSAAAVSAGLLPFALGTETWGSIVSPCTRCGVTGLRPTFGRVSRAGAMALSWSMDKIGPICRSVEDCALVFDVIRGSDGRDATVVDAPFPYRPDVDLSSLRIGYLEAAFAEEEDPGREQDRAVLEVLRSLGGDPQPMALPDLPAGDLAFILSAEAAAAFDELTRSGRDDLMVRQVRNAWPNVFRAARFIPAVEYLQANRIRSLLIERMAQLMDEYDVYVSPSFGGDNLLVTNLTGHPCVVVPDGFREENAPGSITFIGRLFDEATVLAVARAYQEATDFHRRRPPGYR